MSLTPYLKQLRHTCRAAFNAAFGSSRYRSRVNQGRDGSDWPIHALRAGTIPN
jgi:hypothetical protein